MGRPAQGQPERLETWERSGEMLRLRRQVSELLSNTRELVEKVR